MNKQKITVILAAAGSGTRSKLKENKIFFKIDGEPIILKTAKIFDENTKIDQIIITYSNGEKERINSILKGKISKPIIYIEGGKSRFLSVKNALDVIDSGIVLIHDAVRPFLSQETLYKCIKTAIVEGSAVVGSTPTDTIMDTDGNDNIITSSRRNKFLAKTPQAFDVLKLKKAYELAEGGEDFTDDAGVYTSFIGKCKLVIDNERNPKLTYPEDFSSTPTRIGVGFDLHKLVENRKLILGGIEIPHGKGLLGHSDADVLTHAIMDSLLASASLRDIGYHFSDKDEKYKDISSIILLKEVMKMLEEKNIRPISISAVIMAEKPKLLKHIPKITKNLASIINIEESKLGITATTLEGIGIVGREEGIACQAYSLCEEIKD